MSGREMAGSDAVRPALEEHVRRSFGVARVEEDEVQDWLSRTAQALSILLAQRLDPLEADPSDG